MTTKISYMRNLKWGDCFWRRHWFQLDLGSVLLRILFSQRLDNHLQLLDDDDDDDDDHNDDNDDNEDDNDNDDDDRDDDNH